MSELVSGVQPLRVGVLGAGFMGSTHARAYHMIPGVELVGVTSRRLDRARTLAEELGTKALSDPNDLIADATVDAIDVCLPTPEHARYAIAALNAGKHVLVEKPIALTLEDAQAMLDAQQRSGRTLMVAHALRFWPEYVAIHDVIVRGEIGRPFSAQAWRLQAPPLWSENFGKPELTGGAVVDLMIHDFDFLNWLLGTPRLAFGQGRRGPGGGWDHVQASIAYDGAATTSEGSLLMSGTWPFTMGLRVVGERGAITFEFSAGGRSVENMAGAASGITLYPDEGEPRPVPVEPGDGYEAEIRYFVECVRTGQKPTRASPDDAYRALEVALAVRRSLDEGTVVRL